MKPGYILIFIFFAVGSLLGSLKMEYPYPFFIVVAIEFLIYKMYSKTVRKRRERAFQEQLFQLHMRKNNR